MFLLLIVGGYITFLIGIHLLIYPKIVVDAYELCEENKDSEDSTYKFLWFKEKPMTPKTWMFIIWATNWTEWPISVYVYLMETTYYKNELKRYQ